MKARREMLGGYTNPGREFYDVIVRQKNSDTARRNQLRSLTTPSVSDGAAHPVQIDGQLLPGKLRQDGFQVATGPTVSDPIRPSNMSTRESI